jgi:hypothetical protein
MPVLPQEETSRSHIIGLVWYWILDCIDALRSEIHEEFSGCPAHKPPRARPCLEGLERRECPTTQNFWTGNLSALASVDGNWSLNHVATATEQAVFTGSSNNAFEADSNLANGKLKVDSIVLQTNYTAAMQIDSGVVLEAANGFTQTSGTANIDFKSTTSKLQIDAGNSGFQNIEFTDQQGTVDLKGGTLAIGNSAVSDTFANFLIEGSLTVNNTATLKFQSGAGLTIASGASMTLSNTHIQSLWSTADTGGILENWGTFTYTGGGGGNPTWIAMPFLNHGTTGLSTGQLKITNRSTATSNYSMMMDSGTLTLANGMDLIVDQGYYQTGGLFSVADATAAKLDGNAELDGGTVQLGTATTYGFLEVTGNLKFDGTEYDAKINGQQGGTQDKIQCDKTTTITTNSKLVVTSVGAVAAGKNWVIISDTIDDIVGDFSPKSTGPNGVNGQAVGKVYHLTS